MVLNPLRAPVAVGAEAGTEAAASPGEVGCGGAARHGRRGAAAALLRLARPRQWTKNLLVFAAPVAGRVIGHPGPAARATLAFVAFTLAAVAVYCANDLWDLQADRLDPVKRSRPLASGAVPPRRAVLLALACTAGSLAIAVALGPRFLLVVACYLALSAAYTAVLKQVPVFDVVAVASCYLLRAVGGAEAIPLRVSNWFLMVSLFGALFLVAGKRRSELARLGPGSPRAVLAAYPLEWLQQVITMALAGTVVSYCLWAFQFLGHDVSRPVLALSVLPFVTAQLRYGLLVATGEAESPERALLADRLLLGTGLAWAALLGGGLYLA